MGKSNIIMPLHQ